MLKWLCRSSVLISKSSAKWKANVPCGITGPMWSTFDLLSPPLLTNHRHMGSLHRIHASTQKVFKGRSLEFDLHIFAYPSPWKASLFTHGLLLTLFFLQDSQKPSLCPTYSSILIKLLLPKHLAYSCLNTLHCYVIVYSLTLPLPSSLNCAPHLDFNLLEGRNMLYWSLYF